ncbi:MAG TPA: YiiX/YebB-like N1pC/P60 family cysteine hydrolase, partial [bacterium]|nr:YiiX/YebB-like N1pC/P60 family cysteine hydrolase [bacterium]
MFYQNKKFIFQLSLIFVWLCYLLLPQTVFALTPGALIYRTTSQGKMFGYTTDKLLEISNGILTGINPGHVGIYVGQGEDGEHYVVEALAGGVVKTPAKYFVNEEEGEKLLGVKIPQYASDLERFKAVKIAESLVGKKLGYDFDFKKQKGPGNGDWTCVGLVEKVYESAGISNPNNLKHLEYNPNFYAVDITPDGFDNQSVINAEGDCFAQNVEFSKIARRTNLILPLPEVIGFDAGLEHKGERYIFLPYTQFIQPSLVNERVDIDLTSDFSSQEIRGKTPTAGLFLRWSLINNPLSSLKSVISKKTEKITNLITKIFNNEPETEIVLTDLPVVPAAKAITPEKKVVINQNVNNQNKNEQNKNKQTSAKEKKNKKDNEDIEILEEDLAKEVLPTKINSATKINSVSSNANQKDVASKTSPAKTQNLATTNQETINITKTNITPPTSTVSVSKISAGIKTVSSNYNTNDNGNSNSRANSNFSSSSDSSASSNFSASANNNSALLELVINKIYATGNNDFIEIYNPTDYAIDLAEAGIRLEKSKTAEDPGLMIRIGNLKDGSFPGGTVIGAKSYYLIVRDDASPYHLNLADAIATRSEFNFTGNGYIIYLGKGAISSSADTDIIDAVGYGEAKYFQGVGPAPVINDNYFLNKTKNTGNNNLDFNLLVSSDPNIVWEDEEDNEDNNDANNDAGATNANDNSNTNTGNNSDTSDTTDTNNGS